MNIGSDSVSERLVRGQVGLIIACGPSSKTAPLAQICIDHEVDFVIAINEAWRVFDADYWVCRDGDLETVNPNRERRARFHVVPYHWVVGKPGYETDGVHLHFYKCPIVNASDGLIPFGAHEEDFLRTGRIENAEEHLGSDARLLRGQRGMLVCWGSCLNTAIHLAMVLGARHIPIVGADYDGDTMSAFDERPMTERKRELLRRQKSVLDRITDFWAPRGIRIERIRGSG